MDFCHKVFFKMALYKAFQLFLELVTYGHFKSDGRLRWPYSQGLPVCSKAFGWKFLIWLRSGWHDWKGFFPHHLFGWVYFLVKKVKFFVVSSDVLLPFIFHRISGIWFSIFPPALKIPPSFLSSIPSLSSPTVSPWIAKFSPSWEKLQPWVHSKYCRYTLLRLEPLYLVLFSTSFKMIYFRLLWLLSLLWLRFPNPHPNSSSFADNCRLLQCSSGLLATRWKGYYLLISLYILWKPDHNSLSPSQLTVTSLKARPSVENFT